jgi:hypothetical protein
MEHPKAVEIIPFEGPRGIWRALPPGRRRCSCRSPKASERAFFGQVQADAEDSKLAQTDAQGPSEVHATAIRTLADAAVTAVANVVFRHQVLRIQCAMNDEQA